jgi:hypothetical protein
MDKRTLFFMITVLILASLACNASAITDQPTESTEDEPAANSSELPAPEGEAPEQDAQEEQTAQEEVPAAADDDPDASQPAALPIGLREGLASFNSFRMTMNTINNGPTPLDRDESRIEVKYDAENDVRHMHTETVSSSADYPEVTNTVEDQYQVGLTTCTISSDGEYTDASSEEMTPLERDMAESAANLFDMIITAENPTLVGEETVNGIPSNHYTFKLTGLGDYSGAEVKMADGEYWVALDGQYLVKYALVLEAATGPEGDPAAEIMHGEYSFELQETNQPVNISLPPECTS